MRLSTAQDLSFQDLPYIYLPLIAQGMIERYLSGDFSNKEVNNVNQFISSWNKNISREQLDSLITKISDAWVFLVNPMLATSPGETLVSLKTNLDVEQGKQGLQIEDWIINPELTGTAKFSAELLIQRLTYHERIYGVTQLTNTDENASKQKWPVTKVRTS